MHHPDFSPVWVAEVFDLGKPGEAVTAACGLNSTFGVLRFETSQGVFAIKRSEQEPRCTGLAVEAAAYEAGFPMPRPLVTTEGRPYAICLNEGKSVWVRAHAWVEGAAYPWETVDPQVSHDMGKILAALHAIPFPADTLQEDDAWAPLGTAGWEQLLEQALARDIDWANILRVKIPVLVASEEHVLAHTVSDEPVIASHRDLHPPNVMRRPDGSHALVDWDGAGPVNAREEVAMFALVWGGMIGDAYLSKDAVQSFVRGYRAGGGHFVSRGYLDLTHRLCSLLWWIAYNVRRDISGRPGPDPDMTPTLLLGLHEPDVESMQETAQLLDVS